MKIYTRTGDRGETELLGGNRVGKDSLRLEAYGAIDELNSTLGIARAERLPEETDRLLRRIQDGLFEIGSQLATPNPAERRHGVGLTQIKALEDAIDQYQAGLKPPTAFILPTGTRAAADLHFARTVCRRAERRVVALMHHPERGSADVAADVVAYLNRLSDLLFVLARTVNARAGVDDAPWRKSEGR